MSYVSEEQETVNRIAANYYDRTGRFLNLEGIFVVYDPNDPLESEHMISERECVPLIRDRIVNPALRGYGYNEKLNDTLEMLLDLVVSTRDKEQEKGITSKGSFGYNDLYINWITPYELSQEQQIINKVSLEYFKKSKSHLDFSDICISYKNRNNYEGFDDKNKFISVELTESGIIYTKSIPDFIRRDLISVLDKHLSSAIEHRDYGIKAGYIGWEKIYKGIKISWSRQDLEEEMY